MIESKSRKADWNNPIYVEGLPYYPIKRGYRRNGLDGNIEFIECCTVDGRIVLILNPTSEYARVYRSIEHEPLDVLNTVKPKEYEKIRVDLSDAPKGVYGKYRDTRKDLTSPPVWMKFSHQEKKGSRWVDTAEPDYTITTEDNYRRMMMDKPRGVKATEHQYTSRGYFTTRDVSNYGNDRHTWDYRFDVESAKSLSPRAKKPKAKKPKVKKRC